MVINTVRGLWTGHDRREGSREGVKGECVVGERFAGIPGRGREAQGDLIVSVLK